jgi:rhodanese-related sulfurtransferase
MQSLAETPELIDRTPRVTAAALAEQLDLPNPPLLIDVRAEQEFKEGRIDGAINVPLSRIRDQLDQVPTDRPVVVYCTSGYRSAIAASVLRREQASEVTDLVGGLGAWDSR